MNHGHWILAFARRAMAVATESGTIQSARANFTMVATASASTPYFAAAPTTELVSWIASAAHSPNCVCVSLSPAPIAGKISSATEFNTNTVPSDTAISSSLACTIGPTAAMALPPQIAVPVEIRNAGVFCTPSSVPRTIPATSAKVIPRTV